MRKKRPIITKNSVRKALGLVPIGINPKNIVFHRAASLAEAENFQKWIEYKK